MRGTDWSEWHPCQVSIRTVEGTCILSAFPGHCAREDLSPASVAGLRNSGLRGQPIPRISPEETPGSKSSPFGLGVHGDPLTCFYHTGWSHTVNPLHVVSDHVAPLLKGLSLGPPAAVGNKCQCLAVTLRPPTLQGSAPEHPSDLIRDTAPRSSPLHSHAPSSYLRAFAFCSFPQPACGWLLHTRVASATASERPSNSSRVCTTAVNEEQRFVPRALAVAS